jgi:hypothetical protein
MKATIEISDELYRKVKAKTALEGRRVREVAQELFRRYVNGDMAMASGAALAEEECPIVIDGKVVPRWFGRARKYARLVEDQGMDAVRESIAKGWAREVADREAAMRRIAKP